MLPHIINEVLRVLRHAHVLHTLTQNITHTLIVALRGGTER